MFNLFAAMNNINSKPVISETLLSVSENVPMELCVCVCFCSFLSKGEQLNVVQAIY